MKRNCYVIVDGVKIAVKFVKFMDVEEDMFGRDLMTFEFEGKIHKSYIFGA